MKRCSLTCDPALTGLTLHGRYRGDDEIVVKESCEVALDIIDYWAESS